MKSLVAAACLLGLAAPVTAQSKQRTPPPCDASGEIASLDRDGKMLSLHQKGKKPAEGSAEESETLDFHVDESAVPGWYINFKVGDQVSVSCKDVVEQGPTVVGLSKLRKEDR